MEIPNNFFLNLPLCKTAMETEPEESDNGEKSWLKRSNVLGGYNRRTVQTHAPARQIIVPLILTDRFILDFI